MFIYLGDDHVVKGDEIIAILDYQLTDSSPELSRMIQTKQNKVKSSKKVVKSIVITEQTIYFSSLSTATLKKKTNMFSLISNLETY